MIIYYNQIGNSASQQNRIEKSWLPRETKFLKPVVFVVESKCQTNFVVETNRFNIVIISCKMYSNTFNNKTIAMAWYFLGQEVLGSNPVLMKFFYFGLV